MSESFDIGRKISAIEAELANLDHHRSQLLDELAQLHQQLLQKDSPAQPMLNSQGITVNNQSSQEEKSGYSVLYSKGGRTYSHAGSKIPKPESQVTPPSVVMNGRQVSARSRRFLVWNVISEHLQPLMMKSFVIILWGRIHMNMVPRITP